MKLLPFPPRTSPAPSSEALSRVLLESLDSLYATAYRLTGHAGQAQELVQETARKALQKTPSLPDERRLRAWLFKVLINGLRDQFRRQRLWKEEPADEGYAEDPQTAHALSLATSQDVRTAIGKLKPALRTVTVLIDVEGFTLAEAAEMLNIPPGTVASRLSTARGQLRELLAVYREQNRVKEGRS